MPKLSSSQRLYDLVRGLLLVHFFIAACAVLLCMSAEKIFLGSVPALVSPLHGLLAASTLVAYNVHSIANGNWVTGSLVSRRSKMLHRIVVAGAGAVGLFLLPFVSQKIWIGLAVLGLITAAYSMPLLPFYKKQRLKDFGGLKLGVLVSIWVLATTWLPALKWSVSVFSYLPELVIRFALLLALCIAFDIRDVAADRAAGIGTLPVRLGLRRAYQIAFATLILCMHFAAMAPASGRASFAAVLLGCAYACWAIDWSRRKPSDIAYLLLVDGALAVYAAAALLT